MKNVFRGIRLTPAILSKLFLDLSLLSACVGLSYTFSVKAALASSLEGSEQSKREQIEQIEKVADGADTKAEVAIRELPMPLEADADDLDSLAIAPLLSVEAPSDLDTPKLAQVTSVSELSDVQPGDWAYTALQRLVEEYGCLEGYPDRTFRGSRALTRYEFAAGLNACLDVVVQLIQGGADFAEIERLQREFADELAEVRSQTDTLQADVAQLEASQFSTTTKLNVQLYTHLNYATASGDVLAEGASVFVPARDPITNEPVIRTLENDPEPTFSYYTWINFGTSFTGEDLLQLQLVSGDGNGPANFYGSAGLFNTFGVPFTLQTGTLGEDNVIVREVFYSFPVGDLAFTIGPAINWYRHFDNNRFTFFGNGANSFNSSGSTQANAIDRGAGAVVEWDIADWLDLRLGYLAENTEFLPGPRSSSDNGLFAGTTTLTGQASVYPADNLSLRFLYTRSNLEPNAAGFVGGTISEPIYGFADDGFGGPLKVATADTFLFNFDWLLTKGFGLFGRYSYGSTNLFPVSDARENGTIDAQSFQVGLAFPDLFKAGAQGNISYVQPFDVQGGRSFLASGGGDGSVQQEIEVTYRYPLTRNISLIPSFYWIGNVNNFGDNPDLYVFNLQAQFGF